jgi:hypothetical protein
MASEIKSHYPKTKQAWANALFSWAYANLFWGLIAMGISLFFLAVSKGPMKVPGDLSLSLVVLAMTIAASATDVLKEYQSDHGGESLQWMRRAFVFFLLIGTLLAAVSTPTDVIDQEKLDNSLVLTGCLLLLLTVIPFGFAAYAFSLKGRDAEVKDVFRVAFDKIDSDAEFVARKQEREDRLQAIASQATDYNGVKV